MMTFLSAGPVLPFSIALAATALLALIELIGLVFGHTLSHLLDGLFAGDHQIGDHHGAHDIDATHPVLAWVHVGRVPVLVLIVLALACFGSTGVLLQAAMLSFTGAALPGWLASAIALPVSVLPLRVFGGWLGRILPRDETSAVSHDDLLGREATVVLGEARAGSPAQARVHDRHGQAHYVMLVPADSEDLFTTGERVLLLDRDSACYRATRAPAR
jgi:hypothetical protein